MSDQNSRKFELHYKCRLCGEIVVISGEDILEELGRPKKPISSCYEMLMRTGPRRCHPCNNRMVGVADRVGCIETSIPADY